MIADASFASARQRAAAAVTAAGASADLVQLRCTASRGLAARRMSARTGAGLGRGPGDRGPDSGVTEPWPDAAVTDTETGGTARVPGESVDRALEAIRPHGPEHVWRPRRPYMLPG